MAVTAQMRTQVAQLYASLFGRAPEANGLGYWVQQLSAGKTVQQIAQDMYNVDAARVYYPNFLTNSEIVSKFYVNVLGRQPDADGLNYWTTQLNSKTAGTVIVDMINAVVGYAGTDAAALASQSLFNNKVAVGLYYGVDLGSNDIAGASAIMAGVTADAASVDNAKAMFGIALTNGTDVLSGTSFTAPQVYTPGGDDRINSLQNEDVLIGTGTTNTLRATLGNANDNGNTTITPTLKNIQNVSVDVTGNTSVLDMRFADSLQSLTINRLSADNASGFTFDNIGQAAPTLAVKNSAKVGNTVAFNYIDGVLAKTNGANSATGGDVGNVTVDSVNLNVLHIGNVANTEGFETVNLTSTGTNTIKDLDAIDAETVTIAGSGSLKMVNNSIDATHEYTQVAAGGITIGNGIGIRSIDATQFTGNVDLNISSAVGGHSDPGNSGAKFYTNVKMGAGNDTLWTTSTPTGTSTLHDTIDGGAGNNTLRTFSAGVGHYAKISNVQNLELRGAGSTADLFAFDAALANVLVRNEAGGAQAFTLNNTPAALASSGNIVLRHAISTGGSDTIKVSLADASGTNDTVAVTVQNDLNTTTSYNYTVDTNSANATGTVENLTIADNDTESNTVTLASVADHTGTVTLKGGTAGLSYKVNGTIIAKTLDASAQASNLTLTVGKVDQTIKLGSGNDMLTFDGLDTLDGNDTLSDAGGTDTVRAAFSKDVTGTPTLTGIEKLQIVATANATVDLVKSTGITELALLSDRAVNQNGEIFSTGLTSGVVGTSVITLKNTNLTAINYFGDADGTAADLDGNGLNDSGAYTQNFNGLNLVNNASATVAVNIKTPLANGSDSLSAGDGIQAYNLGQLTTHGVTDLSINVSNEYADANGVVNATTTISNIWDRDLVNLTLSASGKVNVGTVTGNTTNNNIKTFNAAAVGQDVTAVVKALGDSAMVTLADGDNNFNALGSAGNNVTIKAGNGKNTITGTAQSDYIYTGSGNDTIHADRGNNTVKSGAGNDLIDALNGSNTVDVGSGFADDVTVGFDTAGQQNLATTVIAGNGTNALLHIINGGVNNLYEAGAADDVTTTYGFAAGTGNDLSVKFVGVTLDPVASTLNGRSAISGVTTAAAVAGHANYNANLSDLVLFTANPGVAENFAGGSQGDVFMDVSTGAGNAYNVSTGAGNDAIVISQTSTAAHNITGGTGADRIILSATTNATFDTITELAGDTGAGAGNRDIVTNFEVAKDKIDVSMGATVGTAAHLSSLAFSGAANITVDGTGHVALSAGLINASNIEAVINFLAAKVTTIGDAYLIAYDSNGDGAVSALDNMIVFQNMGSAANDVVVELVGSATNDVSGAVIGTILV